MLFNDKSNLTGKSKTNLTGKFKTNLTTNQSTLPSAPVSSTIGTAKIGVSIIL
jgi:hypothetical protein